MPRLPDRRRPVSHLAALPHLSHAPRPLVSQYATFSYATSYPPTPRSSSPRPAHLPRVTPLMNSLYLLLKLFIHALRHSLRTLTIYTPFFILPRTSRHFQELSTSLCHLTSQSSSPSPPHAHPYTNTLPLPKPFLTYSDHSQGFYVLSRTLYLFHALSISFITLSFSSPPRTHSYTNILLSSPFSRSQATMIPFLAHLFLPTSYTLSTA